MGGGRGGESGQAKGRISLPLGHRQWCCVTVGDRDAHNLQYRLRRPLAVV